MVEQEDNKLKKFGKGVGNGLLKTAGAVHSVWQDFANFIKRGNVVDLAVGIVIGGAFTSIVTSAVNDLITPIIGLASEKNLENLFVVLKCPGTNTTLSAACHIGGDHKYPTIAIASADGAAAFLRKKKEEAPKEKTCPDCAEDVKIAAKKCRCCGHEFAPEPELDAAVEKPAGPGSFLVSGFMKRK
ncbi:hypothetical protein HDU76_013220 [Blyttiomyces sp. JEL0837]|nr:hypothetical protein HDU76_013220 [Blyttiomyces sp. JEL0837]